MKHFTQSYNYHIAFCFKLHEPYHHVTCDLVSINQHSHLSAFPLGFLKFHIFCTYNGMLVPVQELVLICISVTSKTMNCINWKLMWVCWTPWRFIELTFRVLTLLLFTVFDIPTSTFSWYNSFFYTYPAWKCIPGVLSVDSTCSSECVQMYPHANYFAYTVQCSIKKCMKFYTNGTSDSCYCTNASQEKGETDCRLILDAYLRLALLSSRYFKVRRKSQNIILQ